MAVDELGNGRSRETPGRATANRLRILHVIIVLGETNGQYNEHCLPLRHEREPSPSARTSLRSLSHPPEIRGVRRGRGRCAGSSGRSSVAVYGRAIRRHPRPRASDRLAGRSGAGAPAAPATGFSGGRSSTRFRTRSTTTRRGTSCSWLPASGRPFVGWCSAATPPTTATRRSGSALSGEARLGSFRTPPTSNWVERAIVGRTRIDETAPAFDVVSVGRLEKVKDPLTAAGSVPAPRRPGSPV